jgi:hypothetical protein
MVNGIRDYSSLYCSHIMAAAETTSAIPCVINFPRTSVAFFKLIMIGAIYVGFTAPSFADVKVRSYDRGKKTERSVKKSEGKGSSRTQKTGQGSFNSSGQLSPEDNFESGEILVASPPRGFQADMASLKLKLIERIEIRKLKVEVLRVRLPEGQSVQKMIRTLASRYPAATVDANHRYDLSSTATRPRFPRQLAGWSKVPADCGKGVRIGMIDSAVDVRNPVLIGQNIVYRSFHDKTRNPAKPGHGTSIASLLIGKPMRNGWSGLLPGAQLFAASMFEIDRLDQTVGNSSGLLKALDWLISNKVRVVNLSIAGASNKTISQVMKKARKSGMILVASVGNWGSKRVSAYPAAYRDVVAVTATGKKNRIFDKANRGRYIDFAAPGEGVWVPVGPQGQLGDGTSYAAPFISVLAGLHVAKGLRADPEIFRRKLRRLTVDLGKRGRDSVYGWGLVKASPTCTER